MRLHLSGPFNLVQAYISFNRRHKYCIFFHTAPSGAPRNFTISVDKTTLHFEWDPPDDDGTLVSYTLSCSHEGDNDFDVELNIIEEITIDEFLPSTTYECTILATTNGGDGPTASQSATTEGNGFE